MQRVNISLGHLEGIIRQNPLLPDISMGANPAARSRHTEPK
jgi:hypothetical protein